MNCWVESPIKTLLNCDRGFNLILTVFFIKNHVRNLNHVQNFVSYVNINLLLVLLHIGYHRAQHLAIVVVQTLIDWFPELEIVILCVAIDPNLEPVVNVQVHRFRFVAAAVERWPPYLGQFASLRGGIPANKFQLRAFGSLL